MAQLYGIKNSEQNCSFKLHVENTQRYFAVIVLTEPEPGYHYLMISGLFQTWHVLGYSLLDAAKEPSIG